MKAFCSTNQIHLLPARTPTIQGLVEWSNSTFKENMRNLIMSLYGLQISKWCKYTMQASCIMNITYHHAINITPYGAVFHMKAKGELLDHDLQEGPGKQKRYSRSTGKLQYQNDWTVWSNSKKKVYKVDDMVSIKIDKVDKKSPFHPNLLLGKVLEIENNYVKVVKPFGRIKGFIVPSRLFPCTATK